MPYTLTDYELKVIVQPCSDGLYLLSKTVARMNVSRRSWCELGDVFWRLSHVLVSLSQPAS